MSDAAHMLSDVSAFLVSIFAAWAATQPGTQLYSFGYHRAEILGALASVLIIWLVTGALVFEAVQRTINPVRVDGKRERRQGGEGVARLARSTGHGAGDFAAAKTELHSAGHMHAGGRVRHASSSLTARIPPLPSQLATGSDVHHLSRRHRV
jgi:zinc transporter 2